MDFDSFYSENFDRIHRAMTLRFRDPSFAEEITQEAFYRALKRWPKVAKLDHPEAWTMIVALNRGRDLARRKSRQVVKTALRVEANEGDLEGSLVEDRIFISDLLTGMSERQRQALLLRYIIQLTIPEIAVAMGCAEGTVKSTLHAALENAANLAKGTIHVSD